MELTVKPCRICLSETEFNVSLFGNYCRKTKLLDKILVCLRLPIEDNETLNTICHRCAENVERYYDFINYVKKAQAKLGNNQRIIDTRPHKNKHDDIEEIQSVHMNKRLVTSYVREQIYDADYTFSFLETPNEEKKEPKPSSPFFSYFSPPNIMKDSLKVSKKENIWKTPQQKTRFESQSPKNGREKFRKDTKSTERSRQHSRDLFESQSQDVEEPEPRSLDWRLTPDDNIMKRVRENCFGLSEF